MSENSAGSKDLDMAYATRMLVCDEIDPITDRELVMRTAPETARMILSIPDTVESKTIFVQDRSSVDVMRARIEVLRGAPFAKGINILPATEDTVRRKAWPTKTTFVDHAVTSQTFRKLLEVRQATFA